MLSLILTFSFWPMPVYSHSSLTICIYQGLQPSLAYLILLFLNKNTLRNWYGSQNDIHKKFKKELSVLEKKFFLKELKRKRSWNYKQLDLGFCVMTPGIPLWEDFPQLLVCILPRSLRENELDLSAIFTAIEVIQVERKSIRCVHLCLTKEERSKEQTWDVIQALET